MEKLINWFKGLFGNNQKPAAQPARVEAPASKPKPAPEPARPEVAAGLPWVDWFRARLGWTEFDHDKELSKGWKYTNVPYYKSVIGANNAWCAMSLCTALEENGFKSPKNAAAISFKGYGTKCEPKKGAVIVIEHANGGHHVTTFDSWADQNKKLARCLGGNQQNAIRFSVFDVSGNSRGEDEIIWSGWPVRK